MPAGLPKRFGPYILVDLLGEGGVGTVHLAKPLDLERGVPSPIVIKRLQDGVGDDPVALRRFRHEAAIAVSVDNPHVVKIYDVGAVDKVPYIAMEYILGWSMTRFFQALLAGRRFAPVPAVVHLIIGGLRGLQAIHEARDPVSGEPMSAVHRDISPRNVLIDEEGRMRLIDLGLGKSNIQDWRTRTGMVMGSPGYMVPEQSRGERVDHRADIYSMATLLYEALVLQPYIPRGDRLQMLRAMEKPNYIPTRKFRNNIPEELDQAVRTGLAKDPDDRFQTTNEFIRALEHAVPEPPGKDMASLLLELMPEALDEMRQRVAEINGIDPDEELRGADPSETVVFAHRSSVLTLRDREDTNVDPTEPVEVASPSIPAQPPPPPPRSVPPIEPTRPMVRATTPVSSPEIRISTRRAGVPLGWVIALVIAAVALTLMVERTLLAPAETAAVERPAPPPPVQPRVVATEKRVEAPPPPTPPPPPAATPSPERRSVRPAKRKSVTPIEAPPPPVTNDHAAVKAAFSRLAERAQRQKRAHPEQTSAINRILADASIWVRSKNYGEATKQIDGMHRRLDALR